jgi:shikimate kinase
MNIVLIGMRGSGKSTIAQKLSDALQSKIAETDKIIENIFGKSVLQIVRNSGWKEFRRIESAVINVVSNFDQTIISTGGGVVLDSNNIKVLKSNGKIYWLKVSPEILIRRVGNDRKRPLLTDANNMAEDIQKIYRERFILYKNSANNIINSDGKTAEDITREILVILKVKVL